jgi:hypothetical protein
MFDLTKEGWRILRERISRAPPHAAALPRQRAGYLANCHLRLKEDGPASIASFVLKTVRPRSAITVGCDLGQIAGLLRQHGVRLTELSCALSDYLISAREGTLNHARCQAPLSDVVISTPKLFPQASELMTRCVRSIARMAPRVVLCWDNALEYQKDHASFELLSEVVAAFTESAYSVVTARTPKLEDGPHPFFPGCQSSALILRKRPRWR